MWLHMQYGFNESSVCEKEILEACRQQNDNRTQRPGPAPISPTALLMNMWIIPKSLPVLLMESLLRKMIVDLELRLSAEPQWGKRCYCYCLSTELIGRSINSVYRHFCEYGNWTAPWTAQVEKLVLHRDEWVWCFKTRSLVTVCSFSCSMVLYQALTLRENYQSPHMYIYSVYEPPHKKLVNAMCEQQRRRSACASAQSDQHLCCLLPG